MARGLVLLYPVAMGLALVWTGDHYVVDVLLGWLVASMAWWVQPRLAAALRSHLGRVHRAQPLQSEVAP